MRINKLRESDVKKLQQSVLNIGQYFTLEEIEGAWYRYSERMGAGWMAFPEPGNRDDDMVTYRTICDNLVQDFYEEC